MKHIKNEREEVFLEDDQAQHSQAELLSSKDENLQPSIPLSPVAFELDFSGNFQFISDNSSELLDIPKDKIIGHSVAEVLGTDGYNAFMRAVNCLLKDDSHSYHVRFQHSINANHANQNYYTAKGDLPSDEKITKPFDAIGILIRHPGSAIPAHTMWVVNPATNSLGSVSPLVTKLLDVIGFGASLLDKYLCDLRTSYHKHNSLDALPLPTPEFCQICEREIQSWFFELHSKFCLSTSTYESVVQAAQDSLLYFRSTLLEIQEGMQKDSSLVPVYKNEPLIVDADDYFFTDENKQTLSLCSFLSQVMYYLEVAIDITIPPVKIIVNFDKVDSLRVQSPRSEKATIELDNYNPSLENCSSAVIALWEDIKTAVDTKITGVLRLRNAIYYSERIRLEIDHHVQEIIDDVVSNLVTNHSSTSLGHLESKLAPSITFPDACDALEAEECITRPGSATNTPQSDRSLDINDLSRSSSYSRHLSHVSLSNPDFAIGSPMSQDSSNYSSPLHRRKASDSNFSDPRFDDLKYLSPNSSPRFVASDGPNRPASNGRSSLFSRGRASNLGDVGLRLPSPSPRIHTIVPNSAPEHPSINDYKILKPISKGAFGSVYLAQKRTTGDYFAIKILKKSNMIAKNQVINVRAERAILMSQGESPFVAKLYYTFQSKDYLYLVMEYLNGGDCGSLLKTMGVLDLDWIRTYIAETVLCLGDLHDRGIIHRDIKPENLLISQNGHLKLTDFGLSRVGYMKRHRRKQSSSIPVLDLRDRSSAISDLSLSTASSVLEAQSLITPERPKRPSLNEKLLSLDGTSIRLAGQSFNYENSAEDSPTATNTPTSQVDESNIFRSTDSPRVQPFFENKDPSKRFIGTPDYIAPEVILGNPGIKASDWWSLGCVVFEFLFGYPPFNAETPDQVFQNILARRINWPAEVFTAESSVALDLIDRLLCMNPANRLGANGVEEIKAHPFFKSVNWDTILEEDPPFVPKPFSPEDTVYFDSRGLKGFDFSEYYNQPTVTEAQKLEEERPASSIPQHVSGNRKGRLRSNTISTPEFGSFTYRNLDFLNKANRNTIQKLRKEHMAVKSAKTSVDDTFSQYMSRFKAKLSTSQSVGPVKSSRRASMADYEASTTTRVQDITSDSVDSIDDFDSLKEGRMLSFFDNLALEDHKGVSSTMSASQSQSSMHTALPDVTEGTSSDEHTTIQKGRIDNLQAQSLTHKRNAISYPGLFQLDRLQMIIPKDEIELAEILKKIFPKLTLVPIDDPWSILKKLLQNEQFNVVFLHFGNDKVSSSRLMYSVRTSATINSRVPFVYICEDETCIPTDLQSDGVLLKPITCENIESCLRKLDVWHS